MSLPSPINLNITPVYHTTSVYITSENIYPPTSSDVPYTVSEKCPGLTVIISNTFRVQIIISAASWPSLLDLQIPYE